MDKSDQIKLRFDAMPRQTFRAFEYLSKQVWLKDAAWYLAGGTALALHVGYRRSVDLDFFTESEKVDNQKLLKNLEGKNWETKSSTEGTIYGNLFDASVSFISYPFFIPKLPMLKYGSIKILSDEDIAVMKTVAISQRGTKRDFFDLYFCANNILPLEEIIRRLKKQYPKVAHNYQHIMKSLVYFTDAEDDPQPDLLIDLDWKKVKAYFEKEIPELTKKLLNLKGV